MNPETATKAAIMLGALGVLLILAGAFGVIAMNYGVFLGVASFIIAGMVKKMAGIEK